MQEEPGFGSPRDSGTRNASPCARASIPGNRALRVELAATGETSASPNTSNDMPPAANSVGSIFVAGEELGTILAELSK